MKISEKLFMDMFTIWGNKNKTGDLFYGWVGPASGLVYRFYYGDATVSAAFSPVSSLTIMRDHCIAYWVSEHDFGWGGLSYQVGGGQAPLSPNDSLGLNIPICQFVGQIYIDQYKNEYVVKDGGQGVASYYWDAETYGRLHIVHPDSPYYMFRPSSLGQNASASNVTINTYPGISGGGSVSLPSGFTAARPPSALEFTVPSGGTYRRIEAEVSIGKASDCECGAHKTGSKIHYRWCKLFGKE